MKYNSDKHKRRSVRLGGYDYSAPGAYFITLCTCQRQCLFGEVVAGQMELNATGLWVQACWQRLPHRFSQVTLDAFVIMPNHLHGILWLGGDRSLDRDRSGRGEAFGQKTLEQSKIYHPNASPPHNPNVSPIPDPNVLPMHPNGDADAPRKGEAFRQKSGDTPCKGEAFGQKILEQPEIFVPNASPLPHQPATPIQPNGTKSGSIAAIVQNFKSISTRRLNQIQNNMGRTLWQRNYYEHIIRDNTALLHIQNYIRNNPLSWEQDQLHPEHLSNIQPSAER
jgi:putative transposase